MVQCSSSAMRLTDSIPSQDIPASPALPILESTQESVKPAIRYCVINPDPPRQVAAPNSVDAETEPQPCNKLWEILGPQLAALVEHWQRTGQDQSPTLNAATASPVPRGGEDKPTERGSLGICPTTSNSSGAAAWQWAATRPPYPVTPPPMLLCPESCMEVLAAPPQCRLPVPIVRRQLPAQNQTPPLQCRVIPELTLPARQATNGLAVPPVQHLDLAELPADVSNVEINARIKWVGHGRSRKVQPHIHRPSQHRAEGDAAADAATQDQVSAPPRRTNPTDETGSKRRRCMCCTEYLSATAFSSTPLTSECQHARDACRSCVRRWIETQIETKPCAGVTCITCNERVSKRDIFRHAVSKTVARLQDPTTTPRAPGMTSDRQCRPVTSHETDYVRAVSKRGTEESPRSPIVLAKQIVAWQQACSPPSTAVRPVHRPRETLQQPHEESAARAALLKRIERRKQTENTATYIPLQQQRQTTSVSQRSELLGEGVADRRRRREEALSIAKVREISKQCPSCGWSIEKSEGCSHMKCTICLHEFCYECLADHQQILDGGNRFHRSFCRLWA